MSSKSGSPGFLIFVIGGSPRNMVHGTRTESSVRQFGDTEHIRARPASSFTYFEAEPITFFSDFRNPMVSRSFAVRS